MQLAAPNQKIFDRNHFPVDVIGIDIGIVRGFPEECNYTLLATVGSRQPDMPN